MKRCPRLSGLLSILCLTIIANETASAQQAHNSSTDAGVVQLGSPVHVVKVKVPRKLRKQELVAVLSATLNTSGTFEYLNVLGGDDQLAALALDSVRQWQYTPATADGKAVPAKVFIAIGSDKGKEWSTIEADTLPTAPPDLQEQIAQKILFRVDPQHMKSPRAMYSPDPEYSEEAREAKYNGHALLGLIVGRDGRPENVWVIKKLGLGLDQKALDAVRQWKFDPAMKDGVPVPALLDVEVTFSTY